MDEMSNRTRNYKGPRDSDNAAQWPQPVDLWPLRVPNGDLPPPGHANRDERGRPCARTRLVRWHHSGLCIAGTG